VSAIQEVEAPPTERQLQVLTLHARGMTFEQIGGAIGFSGRTVKEDLDRLRRALSARNLSQAIVVCLARGYICIDGRDCRLFVPEQAHESLPQAA
jgi:DNA-binding NarL/FixJ family response regulator